MWNYLHNCTQHGRSQDFSKEGGGVTPVIQRVLTRLSEYCTCRLFAYKKAYKGGGGHMHPRTPLAMPLLSLLTLAILNPPIKQLFVVYYKVQH